MEEIDTALLKMVLQKRGIQKTAKSKSMEQEERKINFNSALNTTAKYSRILGKSNITDRQIKYILKP